METSGITLQDLEMISQLKKRLALLQHYSLAGDAKDLEQKMKLQMSETLLENVRKERE
jgi:hypothetical protein